MLRMAQKEYIKDLYENEEKSLREISRITGNVIKISDRAKARKIDMNRNPWNETSYTHGKGADGVGVKKHIGWVRQAAR